MRKVYITLLLLAALLCLCGCTEKKDAPVEEIPAVTEQVLPAVVEQAQAPAPEAEAPKAEQAPAPVEETPKEEAPTPAPVEETPKEAAPAPTPVEEAPVQTAPEPVTPPKPDADDYVAPKQETTTLPLCVPEGEA